MALAVLLSFRFFGLTVAMANKICVVTFLD